MDDPPEFDPRSGISAQEDNIDLIANTSTQVKLKQMESAAKAEVPQTPLKIASPLSSNNTESNSKFHHTTLNSEKEHHKIKRYSIKDKKVKDLSKFIPGEIPPYNKESKTKFRNALDHFESEVPHFLRE